MLYVKSLSDEELQTLKNMFKNHPSNVSRMRAHAVLLSSEGFNLKDLTTIFSVCRQTTSTWLHSWEENGICGLMDDLRSGRPCKLSLQQKLEAIDLVKQSPRSLKTSNSHYEHNLPGFSFQGASDSTFRYIRPALYHEIEQVLPAIEA